MPRYSIYVCAYIYVCLFYFESAKLWFFIELVQWMVNNCTLHNGFWGVGECISLEFESFIRPDAY